MNRKYTAETEIIDELKIDNAKGWGATPNNANVDYKGLRVEMQPTIFLKLSAQLPIDAEARRNIDAMKAHDIEGGAFGAPTLYITVPDEWRDNDFSGDLPKVDSHEGRHRMNVELERRGNYPVETHIFLQSPHCEWRNRHITPEIISQLVDGGILSESGRLVTDTLFTV